MAAVAFACTPRTTCTLCVEVTSDSSVSRRGRGRMVRLARGSSGPLPVLSSRASAVSPTRRSVVVAAVAHRVQDQRQRPERLRQRHHLGLLRRDFERRGLRDRRSLGLLVALGRAGGAEALVEGQDADVLDDRLAAADLRCGLDRRRHDVGQHQVDAVARQREAAQAGDLVDRNGDRAHAPGQDRGEKSPIARLHDGGPGDRNSLRQRLARDAAGQVLGALVVGDDHLAGDRVLGDLHRREAVRGDDRADGDFARRDVDLLELGSPHHRLRGGGRLQALHDVESRAARHDQRRKDDEDNTHVGVLPSQGRFLAGVSRRPTAPAGCRRSGTRR